MVRLGDADVRIRPLTQFASEHEREDTRQVGLIRDRQQIEQQLDVLLERLGHAHRRIRHVEQRFRLLLGALNAPLDLANVIEVLVEARTVARDRCRPARSGDRRPRNPAGCGRSSSAPDAFPSPAAAKQPLEHHARIDLHRQWRGVRLPAERVHVRAAEPRRAIADQTGEVLGRQLDATGTSSPGRCASRRADRA